MKLAKMIKVSIALSCVLFFSTVQAASVSFDRSMVTTPPDVFSLNLLIDFSDSPTSGGAVDIRWDSTLLQYNNNFVFDSGFSSRDAGFDVIDFQAPGLLSIGFGTLGALINDNGIAGQLSFTSLGGDATVISLQDSPKWAGFFDDAGALIPVNYTDTQVNPVPLPPALWLFFSGLAVFGINFKRKKPL